MTEKIINQILRINGTGFKIFKNLYLHKSNYETAIARETRATISSLSPMLIYMKSLGWTEIVQNNLNKIKMIRLTERGKELAGLLIKLENTLQAREEKQ